MNTLLTIARNDGTIKEIDNPRWLKTKLDAIKEVSRCISAEEARIRVVRGLECDVPIHHGQRSCKLNRLRRQLAAIHGKISRQRHDFYHKLTAELVSCFAFLGTEQLAVKNVSKSPKVKSDPDKPGEYLPNGSAQKSGLNRSILDAAPSMLIGMLRTKAVEAASVFVEANTRKLKPTQRCHCCGTVVKKELKDREHRCTCGAACGRDENAAKTILRWMLEGDFWLGTQPEGGKPPSETPFIAANAA